MMTEEQLNKLKWLLDIRLNIAKEQVEYYEGKGEALEFMKYKNKGYEEAYNTILKDIEKIMSE